MLNVSPKTLLIRMGESSLIFSTEKRFRGISILGVNMADMCKQPTAMRNWMRSMRSGRFGDELSTALLLRAAVSTSTLYQPA